MNVKNVKMVIFIIKLEKYALNLKKISKIVNQLHMMDNIVFGVKMVFITIKQTIYAMKIKKKITFINAHFLILQENIVLDVKMSIL